MVNDGEDGEGHEDEPDEEEHLRYKLNRIGKIQIPVSGLIFGIKSGTGLIPSLAFSLRTLTVMTQRASWFWMVPEGPGGDSIENFSLSFGLKTLWSFGFKISTWLH